VKDAHYREWEAARVDLYVPVEQRAQHRSDFVVRASVGPETLVEPVRKAVLELNPDQPISNVTTVAKLVDGALARPRFLALLFGFFGVAAVVLTVAGLFAVLRFVFATTERDLAIRMAVGATPGDLRAVVLRFAMGRVSIGILAGMVGGVWTVRFVEPLLFGVTVFDVSVWAGGVCLLVGASVAAALGPAWRAGKVDPQRLLQQV
jgi:ABC-type antimicrobial peptide transport system permease subunit